MIATFYVVFVVLMMHPASLMPIVVSARLEEPFKDKKKCEKAAVVLQQELADLEKMAPVEVKCKPINLDPVI